MLRAGEERGRGEGWTGCLVMFFVLAVGSGERGGGERREGGRTCDEAE